MLKSLRVTGWINWYCGAHKLLPTCYLPLLSVCETCQWLIVAEYVTVITVAACCWEVPLLFTAPRSASLSASSCDFCNCSCPSFSPCPKALIKALTAAVLRKDHWVRLELLLKVLHHLKKFRISLGNVRIFHVNPGFANTQIMKF